MQAVILAGGAGTRLRPLVRDKPKSMADFEEKPFLEYQVEYLRSHGVSQVLLCVGHMHEHIERYFGDGARWNLEIRYSVEDVPLGTGGALKHAEPQLDSSFLLLNGDSWFDLDLAAFIRFHRERRAGDAHCVGTLALAQVSDSRAYGSVSIDSGHRIVDYAEKAQAVSPWISAGIYALQAKILELLPPKQQLSLEHDVLPRALDEEGRLYGYPADGFFVDIGTPAGYHSFRKFIEGNRNGH
jgi:NDP-sugar pyrophosphorylase family protein